MLRKICKILPFFIIEKSVNDMCKRRAKLVFSDGEEHDVEYYEILEGEFLVKSKYIYAKKMREELEYKKVILEQKIKDLKKSEDDLKGLKEEELK